MPFNFVQELRQLPLLRLLVPLIIGILFQIEFNIRLEYFIYFIIISLIIWFLINKFYAGVYNFRFLFGTIISIIFFAFGAILTNLNTAKKFQFTDKQIIATAIISEFPEEKKNTFKTLLKINQVLSDSIKYTGSSKIITYIQKDSLTNKLTYGDKIIFSGRPRNVKNPGNPHEFDHKKYLFGKSIIEQMYLKSGSWRILEHNKASSIFSFAGKLRKKLKQIYKNFSINGQDLAVLSALTLGDKSELTEETQRSYVSSGAMHILAVSGLHVGIIYFVLNYIFSFLDKLKIRKYNYGKFIKAVILLFSLWFFALLSGLSPSVRRASIMFSFFIVGATLSRTINIYNSLGASAFLLLVINPYLIKSVGFQLSYIAVLSIVYLQPKIENIFIIRNKILFKIWLLISVSIAAQIGTAPIALYYFHIFPNWFILTNLIVIPATFLIIYSAGLLFITSFIPYVSDFVAGILKFLVKVLNFSVELIEKLPFAVIENISISLADVFIIYIIIILLSIFLFFYKVRFLQLALFFVSILILSGIVKKYGLAKNKSIFVYNINKHCAVNFISNENNIILCDSSLFNKKSLDFATYNNFIKHNTDSVLPIDFKNFLYLKKNDFYRHNNYLFFANKKMLIINDKNQINYNSKKRLHLNYIILSNNIYIYIKDILELYKPDLIIFDSSNKPLRIERWKEECDTLNQKYFSVPEQGAFIYEFYVP